MDLAKLRTFLEATQPEVAAVLDLANDSPTLRAFLSRLSNELNNRGVVDVLRKGLEHVPYLCC